MPPVLPALLESHLQLSKDGTALNAVMHCPLLVSFNLYRMMPLHSYQRPRQSPFKSKEPTYPQASVWCRGLCDCPGWTNLFPPCLGPLPQINLSSWKFPSTLLEDHSSNQMVGIRLQRSYILARAHLLFVHLGEKHCRMPIRCLKDLLRLATHIEHKRIWRPLVIQDRKLQVKKRLRSRVAQEKRKRQKVTASVQTHYKLNSSPACCAQRSPPHVLDYLATSEPAIIIIVKSQMLVTFTGHL